MNRRGLFALMVALLPGLLGAGASAAGQTEDTDEVVFPLRFEGYPAAPPFTVAPPKRRSRLPRCPRCHGEMEPDPTIRPIPDAPHLDGISHGRGRVWCLVCHDEQERGYLRTLTGNKIGSEEAYLQCGACHAAQQKDWYFGAHGKRLENWYGERIILNCIRCHDPHEPTVQPREPRPPPKVRLGLERAEPVEHSPRAPWELLPGTRGEETAHE